MRGVAGFTFTEGPIFDFSKTNVEKLFDLATFADAVLTDFIDGERPAHVDQAPPTNPKVGQIWIQSKLYALGSDNRDYMGVVLAWDGTYWQPLCNGARMTNKSGITVSSGQVVVTGSSSDSSFTIAAGAGMGIALSLNTTALIAADESALVVTRGLMYVQFTGTPVIFGSMVQSGTPGLTDASTRVTQSRSYGICLDPTNGIGLVSGLVKA